MSDFDEIHTLRERIKQLEQANGDLGEKLGAEKANHAETVRALESVHCWATGKGYKSLAPHVRMCAEFIEADKQARQAIAKARQ